MNDDQRRRIRERAGASCEYCRLPEAAVEVPFHVEHIVARQHQASDDLDNLALDCDRCNLFKGPNLAAVDPLTGDLTPLFHPRRDDWIVHFELHGGRIEGKTPIGRATVRLLRMNVSQRVQLRSVLHRARAKDLSD